MLAKADELKKELKHLEQECTKFYDAETKKKSELTQALDAIDKAAAAQ